MGIEPTRYTPCGFTSFRCESLHLWTADMNGGRVRNRTPCRETTRLQRAERLPRVLLLSHKICYHGLGGRNRTFTERCLGPCLCRLGYTEMWSRSKDSNLHLAAFETAASAVGLEREMVPMRGFEPPELLHLKQATLPVCPHGRVFERWYVERDSNSH